MILICNDKKNIKTSELENIYLLFVCTYILPVTDWLLGVTSCRFVAKHPTKLGAFLVSLKQLS